MKSSKRSKPADPLVRFLNRQWWQLFFNDRAVRAVCWLKVVLPKSKLDPSSINRAAARDMHRAAKMLSSRPARTIYLIAILSLISVAAQLLYPRDRTLPFSRLQGNGFVGLSTKEQVARKFQDFDTRIVTVHTHKKALTTSYTDLGVNPDIEETFNDMSAYPDQQRFIPFSMFFTGNQTYSIRRDLNESQLQVYARDVIDETNKKPKDADISLQGTKLVISPSEEGFEYQETYLKSQVLKSDLQNKASIVFAPTILYPKVPASSLSDDASRMQQRINTPMIIKAETHGMTIDTPTIASWVEIVPASENKGPELKYNKAKVTESLRGFIGIVDAPAKPTVVTLLNGTEAGRVHGTPQKTLQFDELVERIINSSSYPLTTDIHAKVATVPPKEIIDRRYSRDSNGMQNLLNYWTAQHRGRYSIDFRTQNGRITAGVNPYTTYPSVGVYRIFVAQSIYGYINGRTITGMSRTSTGDSVDTCMYKMMRDSNEACSSALGDLAGWSANDKMLHDQGFNSTSLVRGAGITTPHDTSAWFAGLIGGSLTTRPQAATLLNIMKSQTSRSGIPAGSQGIAVANKTGASGNWVHDAGVVYHPKDTYILSVFSSGGSYREIAGLTAEINRVLFE